ncbi:MULTISPECIES: DUF2993 domain-containing protein [unclassified Solwaraspora]|uniref:LmeA family phospholipid-binding protein n=1 Tax=unclassified Solwaraspora TaxID=2627926 RepID=UPI00259B5B9A|nr:DUF2993 domain-containing protein [Solwaraspora sp. WMMA2056]WJK40979.1 DUF2993 domain-containing protein [Solwaraspora sp. WMMA2056]
MSTYPAFPEPAPRSRPRRRTGRRLLVVAAVLLVILGIALVVADRVAVAYAERAVTDQIRQQIAAQNIESSEPDVSIGGFPFLTQVLAGDYRSISIVLRDVSAPVNGNSVRLPTLDVDARGVQASLDTLRTGQGEVVAETVQGEATVAYGSVVTLIDQPGVELSERDGQLAVTAPVEILGQQVVLTGTADLEVADGQVLLRFANLDAEGLPGDDAARGFVDAYAQQLSIAVPLPELPFQLDLQQVHVTPAGLVVTATAQDVPLSALG